MATIAEAARAIRAGELSSVELVTTVLDDADRLDDQLGVYLSRFDRRALQAAKEADRELAAGVDRGPLHGIPVGVKDVVHVREGSTTGNSHVVHPEWDPGTDATTVAHLRDAGAIITGKVSANEFAFGAPDQDESWRFPRNPWDPDRWAGGSSSGSGAGVAAGMFLGSVGTDTAGSVRMPAAYCGVVGFKPTTGLLSCRGVIPLSRTFDCVGALARTVPDVAVMTAAMAGERLELGRLDGDLRGDLRGLRVGVDRDNHLRRTQADPDLADCFETAIGALGAAGARLQDVTTPCYDELVDAVMLTVAVEGLTYHRALLVEQRDRYCPASRVGFAEGALVSASDLVVVQSAVRVAARRILALFDEIDVVVSPTVVNVAPSVSDGYDMGEVVAGLGTTVWNGVGSPAASVPMGFNRDGLPFGLQIAGRPSDDQLVLQVASTYERSTGWARWPAPTTRSDAPGEGVV